MGDNAEAFPRKLSPIESETLKFMLSIDDPRLVPLREQAEIALVDGRCPCGCATIGLDVDHERGRPAPGLHSAVIDTQTLEFDHSKGPYDLILFLDHGWLKSLEVVYYANRPPDEFPSIAKFAPPRFIDLPTPRS